LNGEFGYLHVCVAGIILTLVRYQYEMALFSVKVLVFFKFFNSQSFLIYHSMVVRMHIAEN